MAAGTVARNGGGGPQAFFILICQRHRKGWCRMSSVVCASEPTRMSSSRVAVSLDFTEVWQWMQSMAAVQC